MNSVKKRLYFVMSDSGSMNYQNYWAVGNAYIALGANKHHALDYRVWCFSNAVQSGIVFG